MDEQQQHTNELTVATGSTRPSLFNKEMVTRNSESYAGEHPVEPFHKELDSDMRKCKEEGQNVKDREDFKDLNQKIKKIEDKVEKDSSRYEALVKEGEDSTDLVPKLVDNIPKLQKLLINEERVLEEIKGNSKVEAERYRLELAKVCAELAECKRKLDVASTENKLLNAKNCIKEQDALIPLEQAAGQKVAELKSVLDSEKSQGSVLKANLKANETKQIEATSGRMGELGAIGASANNFSNRVLKTRPVLSDVTNRPAKRPFSFISVDSLHKSGVKDSVKRKCVMQFNPSTLQNDKDKLPFQPKLNHSHPSLALPLPGAVPDTIKSLSSQKLNSPRSVTEEQNLLAESSLGFSEDSQRGRITCGVSEGRTPAEFLSNLADQSGDKEEGNVVDKLASSKHGAVEPTTVSASPDFLFQGLERCTALKGVSDANPVVSSSDLLKHCTCSFCSKAGYILADLHYQDVKGKLGAVKRSQKEASILLQKFTALKDKLIHDPQISTESTKLELFLMEQWKSLFVHMENTFDQEGKTLESRFVALKDLRGSLKNDLGSNDNSHSDNH